MMKFFNAFASGLCFAVSIYSFIDGRILFGVIESILCLLNGAIAIYNRPNN